MKISLSMERRSVDELLAEGFRAVCKASEVPAMMPRKIDVDGRGVLVCRHKMRFWALDEMCSHKVQSMAYGVVLNGELVCPHHQWAFDVETGLCKRHRASPVESYEATVVAETVYVKVPG